MNNLTRSLISILCLARLVVMLAGVPPVVQAQDDTSWILTQINTLRANVGLHPYALNAQLTAAATQQSEYMVATCNIAHTWPDGTSATNRARAQGYTGNWISENIYAGTNARALDAWSFWINSPIHYSGLTHKIVNEVGIGIAHGGTCGHGYTLLFGHRNDVTAPPAPPAAPNANPNPIEVVPPTAVPYVPPPPTSTPTATIPTLTPSATWTITPTHTVTPPATDPPPTITPLILPTGPAPEQHGQPESPVAIGLVPSPSAVVPTMFPSIISTAPSITMPRPIASDTGGFTARDLIPIALIGQVILIGVVGFMYFRRAR